MALLDRHVRFGDSGCIVNLAEVAV